MSDNKFVAFKKANRPEKVEIAAPEMVQGIAVEFSENKDEVVFRQWVNGLDHFDLICPLPLSVWWKEEATETEVVYIPVLDWKQGAPAEKRAEISQMVLNHLKIFPKKVKFPEKVVSLPISPWTEAECCNGCVSSASPYSMPCFASEALVMIAEFKKELEKVEEELR